MTEKAKEASMNTRENHIIAGADIRLFAENFTLEYKRGDEVDLSLDKEKNVFVRSFSNGKLYEMRFTRNQDLNTLLKHTISVKEEMDDQVSFDKVPIDGVSSSFSSDRDLLHFMEMNLPSMSKVGDTNVVLGNVPVRKRKTVQSLRGRRVEFAKTEPVSMEDGAIQADLRSMSVREGSSIDETGYLVDDSITRIGAGIKKVVGSMDRLQDKIIDMDGVEEVAHVNVGRLRVILSEREYSDAFLAAIAGLRERVRVVHSSPTTFFIESPHLQAPRYNVVEGEDLMDESVFLYNRAVDVDHSLDEAGVVVDLSDLGDDGDDDFDEDDAIAEEDDDDDDDDEDDDDDDDDDDDEEMSESMIDTRPRDPSDGSDMSVGKDPDELDDDDDGFTGESH